jgi:raffinose/stachyose/melibiose transport system substrate-binding protein
MTANRLRRRSFLGMAGAAAGAAALAACGDDEGSSSSGDKTVDWWHIANTDPGKTINEGLAKEFEGANAGVKVKIEAIENEAFKAKLTTVTQAGNPPDVFHSWGGGVLKQQVKAGLVKPLDKDVSSWIGNVLPSAVELYKVDGKLYGVPFDAGMVGFWYNKELFDKAKVTAPPATWNELLDAVRKLKAAGVVPIALAGAEKWPGHFWWSYLAIRQASVAGMAEAAKTGAFDGADFVTAGAKLKELIDLDPFQNGFLGAKYSANDGQAAVMGNGQAAMELMGQWAPGTQEAYSTTKKGITDKLGFFPFPKLEGGKGAETEVFGGGNGFAVGKNAPKEAFDFIKFMLTPESQRKSAAGGGFVPTAKGAEDGITNPNLKVVSETLAKASAFQLYLDQAYDPAVGTQVNDSVAELFAKKASPEQVAQSIAKVAKNYAGK